MKLFGVNILLLSLLICLGCSEWSEPEDKKTSSLTSSDTWRPVRNHVKNKYGYIDQNGKLMIDHIFQYAKNFEDHVALVQDTLGKYQLLSDNGKIKSHHGFDGIENFDGKPVTIAFKGTRRNALYFFLNKDGTVKDTTFLHLIYLNEKDVFLANNKCDSCAYSKMSQLFDRNGKPLSNAYDQIVSIHKSNLFKVIRPHETRMKKKQYALMNADGKIISDWYDVIIKSSRKNFYLVQKRVPKEFSDWGLINSEGKEVIEPVYSIITHHLEQGVVELFNSRYEGLKGYHYLTDTNYRKLDVKTIWGFKFRKGSKLFVREDSKKHYSFYRMENGKLIKKSKQYEGVYKHAKRERRFLFLFPTGVKKNVWYYDIPHFQSGMAIVHRNKKFGLIDTNGVEILPLEYDSIYHLPNGKIESWKNGEQKIDSNLIQR